MSCLYIYIIVLCLVCILISILPLYSSYLYFIFNFVFILSFFIFSSSRFGFMLSILYSIILSLSHLCSGIFCLFLSSSSVYVVSSLSNHDLRLVFILASVIFLYMHVSRLYLVVISLPAVFISRSFVSVVWFSFCHSLYSVFPDLCCSFILSRLYLALLYLFSSLKSRRFGRQRFISVLTGRSS